MEGNTALEKLYSLLFYLLEELDTNEKKRNIFIILLRRCEFTEDLKELEENTNNLMENFIAHLALLLSCPDAVKRLRPNITPIIAATMFNTFMMGVISEWVRDPQRTKNNHQTSLFIDTLFQGILVDWVNHQ